MSKYHIMPLVLTITPQTLSLPRTTPMVQRQEAIGGMLRWTVPEWNRLEFERVQCAVETVMASSQGMDIEMFVTKLDEAVARAIPDRDFSVQIGSFGIEHKAEKKIKKEARK